MKEIIRLKLKCSEKDAEEIAADIEGIDPQLKEVFDCWCNDRPYGQIEARGYTLQSLMDDYGLGFVGALLTMDWIYKEPDAAIKALQFGIL